MKYFPSYTHFLPLYSFFPFNWLLSALTFFLRFSLSSFSVQLSTFPFLTLYSSFSFSHSLSSVQFTFLLPFSSSSFFQSLFSIQFPSSSFPRPLSKLRGLLEWHYFLPPPPVCLPWGAWGQTWRLEKKEVMCCEGKGGYRFLQGVTRDKIPSVVYVCFVVEFGWINWAFSPPADA